MTDAFDPDGTHDPADDAGADPAPSDSDVVGAGAAGLAAARELVAAGARVVLLEARDRPGGRVLTVGDPDLPFPVELGAEFVHGEASGTRALLAGTSVREVPVEGPSWQAREGAVSDADVWGSIGRVLQRLDPRRIPDRPVAAFLAEQDGSGVSPGDLALARAFLEGFHALDPADASERALAADPGDAGATHATRLDRGYGTLVGHLAGDLAARIRYEHVVERVTWGPGGVSLGGRRARDGRPFPPLRARGALVTVPLGVLEAAPGGRGVPTFEPSLPPAVRAALDRLGMGRAVRATLVFDRLLWGEEALLPRPPGDAVVPAFLHAPDQPVPVFWTTPGGEGRALVAWAGGPRARALPPGPAALGAVATRALADATGADPRSQESALLRVHHHDWGNDPWARGAYAYPRVGGEDAAETLAAWGGRLRFAGEATSSDAMGTVEGALRTGREAALRLLEALP